MLRSPREKGSSDNPLPPRRRQQCRLLAQVNTEPVILPSNSTSLQWPSRAPPSVPMDVACPISDSLCEPSAHIHGPSTAAGSDGYPIRSVNRNIVTFVPEMKRVSPPRSDHRRTFLPFPDPLHTQRPKTRIRRCCAPRVASRSSGCAGHNEGKIPGYTGRCTRRTLQICTWLCRHTVGHMHCTENMPASGERLIISRPLDRVN